MAYINYTMFSLNATSLFPEVFLEKSVREKTNNVRQTFAIFGLIVAAILPSFFIPDATDRKYLVNWGVFGITCGIITFIAGVIFLKWGVRERKEFKEDYKETPRFFNSIKLCVKSKSFRWYIPAEIANWFVFGMLPTIIPLYAKFVLGVSNTFMVSALLGIVFLSATIFINFWRYVANKIGPRKAWICSQAIWIITLLPLMFITTFIEGIFCFFFIGIGLAGSLILIDLIVSDIIDEDEVNTGVRREASYYGVNALFLRFSTIFVFLSIGLIFTNAGWTVYEPENVTPAVIFGLRSLIVIFPAIALVIAIISMYKYPLDGEMLLRTKEKMQEIHELKRRD